MRSRRLLAPLFALLLAVGATGLAACSDDTTDEVKDAAASVREDVEDQAGDLKEDAEDATGTAAARAAAEALRAGLKTNDTADEKGVRSVDAINDVSEELPGDAEVSGVDDGDGDGLDDDGKVQVTVGDQSACVTLPEEGDDTEVESGTC